MLACATMLARAKLEIGKGETVTQIRNNTFQVFKAAKATFEQHSVRLRGFLSIK